MIEFSPIVTQDEIVLNTSLHRLVQHSAMQVQLQEHATQCVSHAPHGANRSIWKELKFINIIFIVLAVIYLSRRPKIKALQNYQYPHVQRLDFERWKQYELWSIDIFLGACVFSTVSTTAAQVVGTMASQSSAPSSNPLLPLVIIGLVGGIGVFVVGLIVSAVFGSMGASLKKRLGIVAPK